MSRRSFLSQLVALPLMALAGFDSASAEPVQTSPARGKPLNIMMKSAWGSDDPTKAAFPFLHGLAWPRPAIPSKSSCSVRQSV
jgi:hypothetical protein